MCHGNRNDHVTHGTRQSGNPIEQVGFQAE